ncbi:MULTISPECIES: hypothetical protein [Gordonia]|uniref:Uncharacterized protein n=2 Tax=Gordonia TaxID=2053 RepID=W9DCC9_9ACTN|nr:MULTISPECIES: hypothetical protein [Gordonia]ETA06062.1 hypothetical protein V525_15000 [Gordonia alkanivorans CGMCC 6845]KSU51284.1 hypothetical protein AS181_23895 [Gordonia sp. SGD-V-85]MDT0223686.1 hypothetical protein [Gordonia sp. AC31]CAE09158.1 hypothetical protein [Gordonia westfalica]SCC60042.1 hypothetical protein GA0061091_1394 [Gordonia sp. v-85]
MLQSTLASATATTTYVAFNPIPIPGLSDRLNTFGGWATFLAYFACAVAIVVGGGFIAWDKITDRGDSKGVKIAIGAIVGTMVIATGATILQAAGGQ